MINYLLSLFQQIIILMVGLFISIFLARVLGPTSYGLYTYLITIGSVFILFARYGVENYGAKLVATDSGKLNFSKVFTFQVFTLSIVTIAYFMYCLIFKEFEYKILVYIYILAASTNFSWYFVGIGKFKYITYFSVPFQLANVALLVLFVSNSEDTLIALWIYILMMALTSIVIFIYIARNKTVKLVPKAVGMNFRNNTALFLPFLFISLYTVIDKLILGTHSTLAEVAIFTNSLLLLKTSLVIITSLTPVLMPMMARKNEDDLYIGKTMILSLKFTIVVAMFLVTMFVINANDVVMFLYGIEFIGMVNILIYLSPLVYFIGISSIISGQYFISTNNSKKFLIIVVIGSLINLTLNLILIPNHGAFGAAFATMVTEFIITLIALFFMRDIISIKNLVLLTIKFIIPLVISIYVCNLLPSSDNYFINCVYQSIIIFIIFVLFILINDRIVKKENKILQIN